MDLVILLLFGTGLLVGLDYVYTKWRGQHPRTPQPSGSHDRLSLSQNARRKLYEEFDAIIDDAKKDGSDD